MKRIAIYALASLLSAGFVACEKPQDIMLSEAPGRPVQDKDIVYTESSLINPDMPDAVVTPLSADKTSVSLTVELPKSEDERTPSFRTDKLTQVVEKYSLFKQLKRTDYTVLPAEYYTLTASKVPAGATTATVTAEIKNYEALPYGVYLLPIILKDQGKEYIHFVSLNKFSMVNLEPKPMKGGRQMKVVAYVETNDLDPRNLANFVLKDSKKPVVDMVVLFAANMNYDAIKQRRYVSFNDKLQPIVNNPEIYIKYLQDRGIKVLVDILPNHQGVGYHNFQSKEDALEFAREMKVWTNKLGIDGWDMDEEYADYPKAPAGYANYGARSVKWYMEAVKEVMPDKLLTLYEFQMARPYGGISYAEHIDYAFADYEVTHSSDYGIAGNKYFSRSIEANLGRNTGNIPGSAQANVSAGYAGIMIFGIQPRQVHNGTATSYFSQISRVFYNEETVFEGPYFKGPNEQQ